MKIRFTDKPIDQSPKEYVRIRIVENDLKRVVMEDSAVVLEIGIGKKFADVGPRRFHLICRLIVQSAKQNKCRKISLQLNKTPFPQLGKISLPELASIIAQNFGLAEYEFNKFKKEPKDGWRNIDEILVCGETPAEMKKGFEKGLLIAEEVNACRTLSNTPGGDMTPKKLAAAAKNAVRGTKAVVKILGKKEMQKLGMGAVLGMAKGSSEEPQFVIIEYWGAGKSAKQKPKQKPLVLIGKGVTFDSGGLNIKPGDSMLEMHMDMSGGAAVIHAIALAAKLKVKANVVGLIPAVENMPSGEATRPGDILKSLSGRTIEVLNTDAEGRVILADAITYAKRYDPAAVAECSTLTGASLIALGQQASALMSTDQKLQGLLVRLGEESGEYVWPFPLWEEYEDMVKGNFGDVSNIPSQGNTRWGGVIGGGMFLREFAKDLNCPFAHLDIAPRMTASPNEFLAKGAAGVPVRLFLALIEQYAK